MVPETSMSLQERRPLPPTTQSSLRRKRTATSTRRPWDRPGSAWTLGLSWVAFCLTPPSRLSSVAAESSHTLPAATSTTRQGPVTTNATTTTTTSSEIMLGEPSCNTLVADTLVCNVVYEWSVTHNTTQQVDVAVEASITCPWTNNNNTNSATTAEDFLSRTNPSDCECLATVSWLATPSSSGGGAAIPDPSECVCEWCPGPDGGISGVSVDCGASTNSALGDCSAIACDGTCLAQTDDDPTTSKPVAAVTRPPGPGEPAAPTTNNNNNTTLTDAPTVAPILVEERRLLWIPSAFYVYNDQQKKAVDLSPDDQVGLQQAYVSFVEDVLSDPTTTTPPSSNTTPRQRQRRWVRPDRRRLTSDGVPEATEVYLIQDVATCPETAPGGVTCLLAYGQYQLLVSPDEDLSTVATDYTTRTQTAIDDGLLQTSLEAVDPDNLLTVHTSATTLTPAVAAGVCSLCANGENPDWMNKPVGNNGGTIFSCADLVDLYAAQPPEDCLNYGSSGLRTDLPAPVAVVFEGLSVDFADYCQCPTSSADSVSPVVGKEVTTCGPFCPANTTVPVEYQSLVADATHGWTCGSLEVLADSVNDVRHCPALIQYAGACCGSSSPESGTGGETDEPRPTAPPTISGTRVTTIESNFLVSNDRGLNAHVMMLGPTRFRLSRSYAAFVGEVVGIVAGPATTPSNSNQTRYLRSRNLRSPTVIPPRPPRRRRLEVLYDASSAEVYALNDTTCPTTVSSNATCAIGFGRYNLFLTNNNDDSATVAATYTAATQDAIEEGLLAETHKSLDPFSWVVIEGTAEGLEPTVYVPPESPGDTDGKGYDEYFMIGIGVSIAIIVTTIVGILCASDWSGGIKDDESEGDPWEKDSSRGSRRSTRSKEKAPEKKKFSPYNKDIPPKTERQEYEMYRAQLEKLVEQKCPEEFDNVDDLMDLFYEREPILLATLEKMPDCSEHLEMEEELRNSQHKASGSFNHSNDSMDWQSFADDGSLEESEEDEDNHDSFADDDGESEDEGEDGEAGIVEEDEEEGEEEEDGEDEDEVDDNALEAAEDDEEEDEFDDEPVTTGALHAHLSNSASLNFTAHTIVEGENEDESSHATGSTYSAPKPVPTDDEEEEAEGEESDEEESIPPPPDKDEVEKFDDEDLD